MEKIFWIGLLLITTLTGCGGGGGGGGGSTSESAPTLTTQPTSVSVYQNETATFSVTASGSGNFTYAWKKNGNLISGATASSYSISSASLSDNNSSFTVDVTGAGGTTTSSAAILTVLQLAPNIVTQPTAQSVIAGQSVQFTVSAAGYPTLSYQWYKNGSAITGAVASSYSTSVTLGDSGSVYSVKVTNTYGDITSQNASISVTQSNLNNIVISEVSTCYYVHVNCWFEIYNPTNNTINLSSYTLKSYGINVSNNTTSITTFNLPSISIAPDAYAIVSGNYENSTQINNQNIKIRNGSYIPYWADKGFIEIINAGVTVDFVIFGDLTQLPTTSGKWNGSNITALSYSANDYGRSIVRPYPRNADTNTFSASDWIRVDWVTPSGRNDIPENAQDADGDGIPDSAEVSGGTFAGLDLYSMGARLNQKDIFIEIDQMNSTDPGIIVRKEALQKVVDVFSTNSISLHIDAGNSFNSNFSIQDFNLGQGSNKVAYEPCVTFNQTTCTSNTSSKRSLYDWKESYMDLKKRSVFHYALFANSQNTNGSSGSSGLAEIVGNDLIISLGNWGLSTTTSQALNQVINFQAGTFMHELGHNLGLRHGGDENTNYKPNYYSVMNYLYQLYGLDPDPKSLSAYERWRHSKGDRTPTLCNLIASPCGAPDQFKLNFSNGSSASLIENSLLESANIGRGANAGAFADWDMNGSLTSSSQRRDLNADSSYGTLTDYNDWANLIFPFARNYNSNSGITSRDAPIKVNNPISMDRQKYILEYDSKPN